MSWYEDIFGVEITLHLSQVHSDPTKIVSVQHISWDYVNHGRDAFLEVTLQKKNCKNNKNVQILDSVCCALGNTTSQICILFTNQGQAVSQNLMHTTQATNEGTQNCFGLWHAVYFMYRDVLTAALHKHFLHYVHSGTFLTTSLMHVGNKLLSKWFHYYAENITWPHMWPASERLK